MKLKYLTRNAIRSLAAASCLVLLLGVQAFAETQLQQPNSLANEAAPAAVEQDAEVTPAGCADSCCGDSCCGNGGCCGNNGCCGNKCCCEAVCCPKKETEEVKKHYWEVKREMVCIPGFRFECNWNKDRCCKGNGCCDSSCGCADTCCNDGCCGDGCCGNGCCGGKCCEKCPCYDPGKPTCGRVRCIKVLEKHDYTCDKCGYKWEVKYIRSGNGCSRCGKGGCGKNGCCCPSCGCASTEAQADLEDVQLTSASEATPEAETEKPSLARRLMPWLK